MKCPSRCMLDGDSTSVDGPVIGFGSGGGPTVVASTVAASAASMVAAATPAATAVTANRRQ